MGLKSWRTGIARAVARESAWKGGNHGRGVGYGPSVLVRNIGCFTFVAGWLCKRPSLGQEPWQKRRRTSARRPVASAAISWALSLRSCSSPRRMLVTVASRSEVVTLLTHGPYLKFLRMA